MPEMQFFYIFKYCFNKHLMKAAFDTKNKENDLGLQKQLEIAVGNYYTKRRGKQYVWCSVTLSSKVICHRNVKKFKFKN